MSAWRHIPRVISGRQPRSYLLGAIVGYSCGITGVETVVFIGTLVLGLLVAVVLVEFVDGNESAGQQE